MTCAKTVKRDRRSLYADSSVTRDLRSHKQTQDTGLRGKTFKKQKWAYFTLYTGIGILYIEIHININILHINRNTKII